MAHDFKLSVNAIVVKDDKILLVKRKDRDLWRIPGGELSLGETVDEAVVAFIKNKLGLDINIKRIVGLYSKPIQNELVILFAVTLQKPSQQLKPTDNYTAADYFDLKTLPDNLPDKNYERINDFKEEFEDVVIRTQMSAPSSLKFPSLK